MATGLTLRAPSPLPVLFTGSPMSFSLLVVPSGGYTGAVNVTCSGIAGVSCVGAGNVVDGNPVAVAVLVSGATGAVVGARTLTIAAGAWQTGPVPVEVVLATLPSLENPTPGTGLLRAGSTVTFRWFAGTGATGTGFRCGITTTMA